MSSFLGDYSDYCEKFGQPDRIELMLCDINAILRGKWLPGDQAKKLVSGGVRLPLSTYLPNILGEEAEVSGLGTVVGDPDGFCQPIPGTLKPIPWAIGNVAQLRIAMTDGSDAISEYHPRERLKAVLDRFSAQGLRPVVATEMEFYLIRARTDGSAPLQLPERSPLAQNYDLEVCDRTEDILTDILAAAKAQGLDTDTLTAEYGPGQFEINFHHTDDVLRAAETALMFRRLVRGVVNRHGLEATFMAKPYANSPGNGMHVHASVLQNDGSNIFDSGDGTLSDTLAAAVGGVLETMRDLQAIFAPHMNSYRRFQPGSFSPTAPDWGIDHRGAAIRLPEVSGPGARLEHRICGADVNPYLALAAVLGGILHGLETTPELPLPLDDPNSQKATALTHDWPRSVATFEGSAIAQDIFGEAYQNVYCAIRQNEIEALTSIITPVEYRYYLGRL